MKKFNTQAAITAGLQNNYNTFNLRKNNTTEHEANEVDAYTNIIIDIITDGDTYVENSSTKIMHAGETTLKDFEGVNPVLKDQNGSTVWDDTNYGTEFVKQFGPYLEINNLSSSKPDIYTSPESYKNYKNQFKLDFKIVSDIDTVATISSDDREYLGYDNEVKSYNNHKVLTKMLGEVCGESNSKYLYFNTTIVHFSKYYNIYSINDSVNTPALVPLLYEEPDLHKYGLILQTDTNGQSIPHMECLYAFYLNNEGTKLKVHKSTYETDRYSFLQNLLCDVSVSAGDNGKRGISQFKSNRNHYPSLKTNSEDIWENQSKGFFLYGMWDNDYWFNNKDTKENQSNEIFANNFLTYFDVGGNFYGGNTTPRDSSTYSFNRHGLEESDYPIVGIGYNGDENNNLRLFNSYFPVTRIGGSGANSSPITDVIRRRTSTGNVYGNFGGNRANPTYSVNVPNKPYYIGLVIASLLTSMYKYKEVTLSYPYISDIVFLSDNHIIYTQDIVYNVKFNNTDGYTNIYNEENSLLLIHRQRYDEYVKTLLRKAEAFENGNENKPLVKLNNINATFKSCIKNIPIQFKLNYIQPNIETVSSSSQVAVYYTDGTFEPLTGKTPDKDHLYYVSNTDGKKSIEELDGNFHIKYLKELQKVQVNGIDMLKGVYDSSIQDEQNGYACNMFKASNGELQLKVSDGMYISDTYSIVEDDYQTAIHNLLKNEVIAPYSKIL